MPVVIGGNIRGATVVSGGGVVVIDGKVYGEGVHVIQGEPLPEVDESLEGVRMVEIDGDDVYLEEGAGLFHAKGRGFCEKHGLTVTLRTFTGTVKVPPVERLGIVVNSGSVRGMALASNLDLKANSGDIRLTLRADKPLPSITAKANSGNIKIDLG